MDQAAAANEKKQMQYINAAGLKTDALEQDLRNDATTLQTHLNEVRPTLIARSSPPASAGINRDNLVAHLAPGTIVVPLTGVYAPPPGPPSGDITHGWVFSNTQTLKISASSSGSGSGWGAVAQPPPVPHDVIFTFTPA